MLPMRKLTIALLALLMAIAFSATPGVIAEEAPVTSDIHLNLKDADAFSPETKGDPEEEAVRERPPRSYTSELGDQARTKEWRTIGTWAADGIQHDLSLGGPVKFNLWWVEDDTSNYDADLDLRWTFTIGGVQAGFVEDTSESNCKGDPCNWEASTSLGVSDALREDIFEIEIEYRAFEDIYIYYDNATFDSGVSLKANALSFQKGASGGETYLEMTEAWPTNIREALEGGFVTLTAGGALIDNSGATVRNGDTYNVNNGSVIAQKITWDGGGGDARVKFSYAANASSYASAITVNLADIPGTIGSSSSDDDDGIPGFELLLAVPAVLFIAARRRRR